MSQQRYTPLDETTAGVTPSPITRPLDLSGPPSRPLNRVSSATVARLSTKCQAALWVAAAGLVLSKGGVVECALDASRSNPFFIYTGLASLSLFVVILLYCVVWVRRVMGSDWEWQIVAPGMIETGTIALVTSFFSFIIGLWPGFGLLTPLVVAVVFVGTLFVTHFLPLAAVGL